MRVNWTLNSAYDVDLPALVRNHLELYWSVGLAHWGYAAEWERPCAFLWSLLTEDLDEPEVEALSGVTPAWERPRITFDWTEEDYARLVAAVPEAREAA